MILFNGATGSLGRFFSGTAGQRGLSVQALRSRLEDRAGLRRELAELPSPQGIATLVQMAARVSVPSCEADPEGALRTNVLDCTDTVLDFAAWANERGAVARVVYVSSGHVYATQPPGALANEMTPTAPRSVYAQSKLAAEQTLAERARGAGFDLTIARVFGLIAPQQPSNYVLPGLLRRVRERNLSGVPGLDYVRDYLDARDVCDALLDLIATEREQNVPHVFNVCSGEPVSLRSIVTAIAALLAPDEAEVIAAQVTAAEGRQDDVPWIVGDPSKLIAALGHGARKRSLSETIRDAI
jgi:GDP-4-dehydro-6-deoxy-D-mannose reductase